MTCPVCRRPAQGGRSSCLYCGAPLAGATRVAPAPSAPPPAPGPARSLLVLEPRLAEPARLARALELSAFEAGQWARRGGWRLHRIADARQVEAEARRLAAEGIVALCLDEAEVRLAAQPLPALEGRMGDGVLEVRTPEGRVRVAAEQLLLAVKGPIVRERQAGAELRRARAALPEPGLRVHLHRRSELAPVELDPELLALGAGQQGSALLQITAWLDALARGRPVDDGFRHLPPALAPAQPAPGGGVAGAASALESGAGRARKGPLLLDNVAQFRFYSAWRAAVERRR